MKKQGKQNINSNDFRTVWKVDAGDMIEFNTWGSHTIDWGDGTVKQVNTEQGRGDLNKHTYVKKGEYTVSISSGVTAFWLNNEESAKKLIEIKQWGAAQWEDMGLMFNGAGNMVCTATDTPDLSKVKSMSYMFSNCYKFNSPIEHWDIKGVKDMSNMLSGARMFNLSLAKMDLRNVVNIFRMLNDTPAFAQDLRDFETSSKANADNLFGWEKSLAQYNLEQAERYAAQEEKQDVYSVLDGAGACRVL